MAKFKTGPTVPNDSTDTYRLGSAASSVGRLVDNDNGKFLKLAGDSQYNLCAAGDPIEAVMVALDPATQDGWAIGTIQRLGKLAAICDGLQASPGTGTLAVGDYVVCGTVVAAGTAMTATTGPKVCKATYQPGTTAITNVNQIADALKVVMHPWRVLSLGNAGAVGDTCVIERV